MAFLLLGVLAAATATDIGARQRFRDEEASLASVHRHLEHTQFDLRYATSAREVATQDQSSLEDSVKALLGELSTTEGTLTATDKTASVLGLDIGTLETCLGGVQGAYRQIGVGDTSQATGDIAGVSTACMTLDGGQNDGLVYPFDFPDPFVLRSGSTYYGYATNSTEGNIQIIESTDLSHWTTVGDALPALPGWARPGGTWAPSVLQVGGTFLLYFAAVVAGPGGGEECISVATATQPQGPFTDHSSGPLVCQASQGGSIDPSPFVAPNGDLYLEWKSNGGSGHPATIWSAELKASGTAFASTGPTALLAPEQSWQAGVVEAPDLVLSGGRYFLFYSGNNWNSPNYAIGVAACNGPLGPCTQSPSQPLLQSNSSMTGPGGESVFSGGNGAPWIAFDAWEPGAVGYPHSRVLFVRPLGLSGATPVIEPAS